MSSGAADCGSFEASRQALVGKSINELSELLFQRFDEDFPSDGLFAGSFADRVEEFVRNQVQVACKQAAEIGADVWSALNDEHTAHNIERFSIVCGFLVSSVLRDAHWPTHEIVALVLFIIANRRKA